MINRKKLLLWYIRFWTNFERLVKCYVWSAVLYRILIKTEENKIETFGKAEKWKGPEKGKRRKRSATDRSQNKGKWLK